ncbi:AsmA family protein [Desulfovibrio oxyclinae]|jgi:hypothetical protein|uniref:AsmA family protein n=1 Tax=Desulfovibrio oxyclinae TaxID=63560 RepID=UPI000374BDFA|nr:AsmA family protein [Desulfovibrio oxyclinae]
MKKFITYGAAGAVLAIIVLVVLAILNLGTLIKTATEEFGPKFTGTEVRLGSADISFLSGSGELNDFLLGNPKGFKTDEAFSVDTIKIKVKKESLTKDKIIIEDVVILSPHITYEKQGKTDNFKAIIANVKKAVASEDKQEPAKTEEGEKKPSKAIQINHLLVKNATVTVGGNLTKIFGDKGVSIPVPDIEMRDIGKEKRTTPAEAVQRILRELSQNVSGSVSGAAQEIGKKAQEALKRGAEAFKKGSDALKSGSEQGGNLMKDAKEGLEGMFN